MYEMNGRTTSPPQLGYIVLLIVHERSSLWLRVRSFIGWLRQIAPSSSTTKRLRTVLSRRPTFPVCTHATSSATICSTAPTRLASSSRLRISTSTEFRRGTRAFTVIAVEHFLLLQHTASAFVRSASFRWLKTSLRN